MKEKISKVTLQRLKSAYENNFIYNTIKIDRPKNLALKKVDIGGFS
jgi:hypothetical protein